MDSSVLGRSSNSSRTMVSEVGGRPDLIAYSREYWNVKSGEIVEIGCDRLQAPVGEGADYWQLWEIAYRETNTHREYMWVKSVLDY